MNALPRPGVTGPVRALNDALHDLHHRAGWPSLRTLARATGVSHTTVSKIFSAPLLPSWGNLELVVEAMGGDKGQFRSLWLAASDLTYGDGRAQRPLIVGRGAELAAVRRHLETGAGLLLVVGEAGVGKTVLVTAAAVTADSLIGLGRCLPLSTDVPMLPVADALRALAEEDDGALLERTLGRCPQYVAASLSHLLPELQSLTSVHDPDDEWSRQRLYQAVGTFLSTCEAERHVALCIEDLHWADTATLDLLEYTLARHPSVPIVGTWRADDPETTAAPKRWRHRVEHSKTTTTLPVGMLSRDETADLLRHVTDSDVGASYVDRVYQRSVGHPLFTELLASTAPDRPLPRVLSELLNRRIADLSPVAISVVRALAVADRGLSTDVLLSVTGLGTESFADGLRELADRFLLAGDPFGEQLELRHPLVAEAARRRLADVESRETHRRLAYALGLAQDAEPGEVATHWRAAEDKEQELAWRIRAAREAESRFAGEHAARHWSRALQIWPAGAAEAGSPAATRAQAFFGAMDGWDLAGQSSRGLELAELARTECAGWDKADQAEVLRKLAAYQSAGGRTEGDELTTEAIRLYRECPQTPDVVDRLAVALIHQSFTLSFRGRSSEATRSLEEAAKLLAGQDIASGRLREVRAMLAWQRAVQGDLDHALDDLATLAPAPADRPNPVRDVMVALHHTDVLLMAGRSPDVVAAAAEPGLAAAREYGLDTHESNTLLANVVIAWLRAGRIEEGASLLDGYTDGDPVLDRWLLHLQLVVVDIARGRLDEAHQCVDRLCALDGISMEFMAVYVALLHVWSGQPDRALEAVESALCAPGHIEVTGETGQMLVLAARAAADLAERGASSVAALRRQLESLHRAAHGDPFGPSAMPSDRCAAAQWVAEVARLNGAESVQHWRRAASAWDQASRPHEAAYCRWRGAQVALAEGLGSVAGRLLNRAAADARQHVPLSAAIAATRGAAPSPPAA